MLPKANTYTKAKYIPKHDKSLSCFKKSSFFFAVFQKWTGISAGTPVAAFLHFDLISLNKAPLKSNCKCALMNNRGAEGGFFSSAHITLKWDFFYQWIFSSRACLTVLSQLASTPWINKIKKKNQNKNKCKYWIKASMISSMMQCGDRQDNSELGGNYYFSLYWCRRTNLQNIRQSHPLPCPVLQEEQLQTRKWPRSLQCS